jgi:hypothetical protein
MKTDMSGGVSTDAMIDRNLEDRLAGRFAVELAGAERDYPALREKLTTGESAVPGRRGLWPRLALPVTTVAVLTVAALVVSGLLLGPAAGPAVGPGPASSSGVVMGADGIPTQIDGERVYRAVNQASFPTSGTFLLGGPVTMPDPIPPCPMQPNLTMGEKDLIPYCYWQAIDGIHVAPKIDTLADLRNRIVVARVHIGDAEAALCPVTIQVQCKAAIVVEDVVWTGGAASSNQATNPTPVQTTPTSAFSETAGPATPRDQIEPDGAPTTLNGQPVYRAANLPTTASFLLGGTLTRDSTCAAPAAPLAKAPGCGYWMVDGVKVGTMVDLPESLLDQPVVVQINRSRSLAVCPGGSCTSATLVIAAIVWPVPPPALSTPPAPPNP